MVRGRRRLRAGRAITRVVMGDQIVTEESVTSPNAAFHGRLSHTSLRTKDCKITSFFSPSRPPEDASPASERPATRRASPPSAGIVTRSRVLNGRTEHEDLAYNILLDTPKVKLETEENVVSRESPPTPHKIQMCVENHVHHTSPSSALSDLHISSLSPKKTSNKASKARTRLKMSQSQNQLPREDKKDNNHRLTEYFPVRRSERKAERYIQEAKLKDFEEALLMEKEDGLEVRHFGGKGRGVVTTRFFRRGEYVIEYAGELIEISEAKDRERKYATDQNTGCYMYYFKFQNQQYCVDATKESGKLGRLVNHSRNGNLVPKAFPFKEGPRLVLIARRDIQPGEEVLYDYGDRSKESLKYHPWLAT